MADTVTESVTIRATRDRVIEMVSHLEDTDRWANEARSAQVQEKDDTGRPTRIKVTLGAVGFTTTATYAVTYTENSVTLECVEAGLIRRSRIVYTATERKDGRTDLEMSSSMVVTVPVPQWGLNRAMHSSARKNLESIRRDAEG